MCISLLLSVMRFYRESGRLERWEDADKRIKSVFRIMSSEQKAICHYERSLFALFGLDEKKLRVRLNEWKTTESLPFFEAKRASLLAEIGQLQESEKILRKSLKNIRAQLNLRPVKTDYSLVSQEAIIMMLLKHVQMAQVQYDKDWEERLEVWAEFSERLSDLRQYKCDPWDEVKIFRGRLSRPAVKKLPFTEKELFDLGRIAQTIHLGRSDDEEALIGYRFLRFCEEAAMPFRMPNVVFEEKSVEGTLPRIYKYSPYWAMATLVRTGKAKAVDHIFNRESLTLLNVEEIDVLIDRFSGALEKNSEEIRGNSRPLPDNFGGILAKILPEILSRLCCKCSSPAKYRLIHLLQRIYESDYVGNCEGVGNLTKRLLNSFSMSQRFELIPMLIDFSFLEDRDPLPPSPFRFLDIDEEATKKWSKPQIPPKKIDRLLEQGLSSNRNARQGAIFTLGLLFSLDLLTPEQGREYSKVLWHKVDSTGFPDQVYDRDYYHRHAFLLFPHPDDVDPASLLKNYILGNSFCEKSTESIDSDHTVSICSDIKGATKYAKWSREELKLIFQKIVECWDKEKGQLSLEDSMSARFGPIVSQARDKFEALLEVMIFAIAPNFDLDTEDKEELLRLIGEFRHHNLPTIRLKAACLHVYPDFREEVFEEIQSGLVSNVKKTVADSQEAVLIMIKNHSDSKRKTKELLHLVDLLAQMIFWQKETVLYNTIKTLRRIIEEVPSLFSGQFERSVLAGLANIADMNIKDHNSSEELFTRKRAAELAYRLFILYRNREETIPLTVERWRDICQSDIEFSEIRNQWLSEQG